MENSKNLFLLDAYALIYRGYYAFIKNPRINSKGTDTSAILGFMNSLFEIIRTSLDRAHVQSSLMDSQ